MKVKNQLDSNQTRTAQSTDFAEFALQEQLPDQATTHPYSEKGMQMRTPGATLGIQKKSLTIGDSNDVYEKEADEVAQRVVTGQSKAPQLSMRSPMTRFHEPNEATTGQKDNESAGSESFGSSVGPVTDSSPPKQRAAVNTVQRMGNGGANPASPNVSSSINAMRGKGQALPDQTKQTMEQGIGHDFSNVRVHTGSKSEELNNEIGAKAFTVGNDIHFNANEYNPGTRSGDELIAHELTHTVQQGGSTGMQHIQRDDDVVDGPKRPHAEGTFDKATMTYTVPTKKEGWPLTKQYYVDNPTEKAEKDIAMPGSDHEYDTYYSIAQRLNVNLDALMKANGSIPAHNIQAGAVLKVPNVPAKATKTKVTDPSSTTTTTTTTPKVEEKKEPEVTIDNYKNKTGTSYTTGDVQQAAWNILQNDALVEDTYLHLSGIKANTPETDWYDELHEFFRYPGGKYLPELSKAKMDTSGYTISEYGPSLNKKIKLNIDNTFSFSVATYMHEMMHYIDTWYASTAAKTINKQRTEEEMGEGVEQYKSSATENKSGYVDMTKEDQREAAGESMMATIAGILEDMQSPTKLHNEHPRTAAKRKELEDETINSKNWSKKNSEQQAKIKQKAIDKIEKDLVKAGKNLYKDWGSSKKGGVISTKGAELGFAFEKAAYGFYDPAQHTSNEWAVDIMDKFEAKYWKYFPNN